MGQRILHLADLHLGFSHSYLGAVAAERAEEADGVLGRIADWILQTDKHDIGAVLIAGDLFDSPWPQESTVERAVQPLRRLERSGIPVVTVPGNHDEWTYRDGVYQKWANSWPGTLVSNANPELVATLELGRFRVAIASCAFHHGRNPASPQWKNPFSDTPDADTRRIGLFHGTLDRIGGIIAEGERAFHLDFANLASWGLDYLALGHIHKRESFREAGCLAHYPGPIEGFGYTDPGSPVLTLVDFEDGAATTKPIDAASLGIRSREVGVRTIDLLQIADSEALEQEALAKIDEGAPLPIRKISLTGHAEFPLSPEDLGRSLASRFLHLEITAEDAASDLGDWEKLAEQRTLEGIFIAQLLAKRETADAGKHPFWNRVAEAGLRALGRDQG